MRLRFIYFFNFTASVKIVSVKTENQFSCYVVRIFFFIGRNKKNSFLVISCMIIALTATVTIINKDNRYYNHFSKHDHIFFEREIDPWNIFFVLPTSIQKTNITIAIFCLRARKKINIEKFKNNQIWFLIHFKNIRNKTYKIMK